ncbi:MAG: CRISPR-associated protein Csx15 [Fimbriimonadales bacterium]|nr:CRISPR-associated protein Csx15 [Fimbriimonadales bacterium]
MTLLNFAHPITDEQKAQIEQLTGQPIQRVIELPVQFDHARGFHEQVLELLERVGLGASEWQTTPLLVNLPSLSVIAATLLAELHGRMGYFPPVLRLRPVEGAVPPRFEVAEILNLQQIRDTARAQRAIR